MSQDLILPDGRHLQEAVNAVYKNATYRERMDTLREFKRTERRLGLSRDHARYYVLSGGSLPPIAEEENEVVPADPEPGQIDDLRMAKGEMEYIARAIAIDFPPDPKLPHLWQLIAFLRSSKTARDYFWMRYMDAISDPRGRYKKPVGKDGELVSIEDVLNSA